MKTFKKQRRACNTTKKVNYMKNINNIMIPKDLQLTKEPYIYPKSSYIGELISENPSYIRYINNAMSLCWGINQNESCNNFIYAIQFEPDNPFSYWGASYTIQMNVNHMVIPKEIMRFSIQCLKKAVELVKKNKQSHPVVADLVHALKYRCIKPKTHFLASVNTEPSFKDISQNMKRWSLKMKDLYVKYPENNDIACLYGTSIMMIDPWKWWPDKSIWKLPSTPLNTKNLKIKSIENVLHIFNEVLKRDPNHLGALHYIIHAIEESPYPALGLHAARQLEFLSKDLGHLIHMPSHIYTRVGDMKKSIETNLHAIKSDEKYKKYKEKILGCQLNTFYIKELMTHNIHFLIIDAERIGNFSLANKYLHKLDNHVLKYIDGKKKENMYLEHFLTVKPHIYLRFGKYKEILKFKDPPSIYPHLVAETNFCKLVSYIKLNMKDEAYNLYNTFLETTNTYIKHLPGETCRCGCQKRHGGIVNPNFGLNKYKFYRKQIKNLIDDDRHLEGTSNNTNNRKIISQINILLVDAYFQWYFESKKNALDLFETATQKYEDLEYDEPSVYMNVVHESYACALYQMGKTKEACIVAARGSIPYPGNIRLNYIQNLANKTSYPVSYYNVSKSFLDFDNII